MADIGTPDQPGELSEVALSESVIDIASPPPQTDNLDPANTTERLVDALATLVRLSRRISDVSLFGVPWLQYAVLRYLAHCPNDIRLTELTDNLSYDMSVVSRMVNSLIEQGLIDRVRDPHDGRAGLMRLSPAGRASWRVAADRSVAVFTGFLSGFSDCDQATSAMVIESLNRAIPEALRGQFAAKSNPPPASA